MADYHVTAVTLRFLVLVVPLVLVAIAFSLAFRPARRIFFGSWWRGVGTLIVAPALLWGGLWVTRDAFYTLLDVPPRASFFSPDGRYEVAVWAYPTLPRAADPTATLPGLVCLRDGSPLPLACTDVEMTQIVERPDWQKQRVSMKLVADWPLPSR